MTTKDQQELDRVLEIATKVLLFNAVLSAIIVISNIIIYITS